MDDETRTRTRKRHGKGIPAHDNRKKKKPKVDPTESSEADDAEGSEHKRKQQGKKQRKKQKKVQYSTSRWPSTSPESEIDKLYVPNCLAAANFPLNVKKQQVMEFFQGKAQNVQFAYVRNKRNKIEAVNSLITFDSAQGATEGLKRNGKMLLGESIYVTRQGNDRKILCVSGFDEMAEEEMKKQLGAEFESRGLEVFNIYLPTNSRTGLCLGFGYIYMDTKGEESKLCHPFTIDGVHIDVRDSTLRTSYLPELLGKKNALETEKSLLKKVLLPIPSGLHDSSGETFSWEVNSPDIIPETVKQDSQDCWAVALTRHYKTLLQLQNIVGRPFLTRDQLKRGVGPAHVVSGKGIDRVKHAIPFMKSIGCDMQVHNRPRGDDVREFEAFEEFIVLLLKQGPVMVNIEYTPGFSDFNGEGIYLPTDNDIYQRSFEKFPLHCLLLTGYGVKDGKQYWRLQDSNGQDWGEGGFIMMERHKCLIKSVVELKITGQGV